MFLTKLIYLPKSIKAAKEIANMHSYFTEKERKTYKQRFKDNLEWIFKTGDSNIFYNMYGLDIVGSD